MPIAMSATSSSIPSLVLPQVVAEESAPSQPAERRRIPPWISARFSGWRGLLLPAAILIGWELTARFSGINPAIMPSLGKVWASFVELLLNGELWLNLSATITRLLIGFAIASVLGLVVGILCALSRVVSAVIGGPLAAIRQVPLFGWIPLIAVLAGIGESSKIVFIVLAAFYPIALNTTQGLKNAPAELVEVGRVFGFSRWLLLRRVLLPNAVPAILTGIKHGLTFAAIATVGAEVFMTAAPGLGNLLDYGQSNMRTDLVLVGVTFIGLLGFALNALVTLVERRLLSWRTSGRSETP